MNDLAEKATCPRCGAKPPRGLTVDETVRDGETVYYLCCQSCGWSNL